MGCDAVGFLQHQPLQVQQLTATQQLLAARLVHALKLCQVAQLGSGSAVDCQSGLAVKGHAVIDQDLTNLGNFVKVCAERCGACNADCAGCALRQLQRHVAFNLVRDGAEGLGNLVAVDGLVSSAVV